MSRQELSNEELKELIASNTESIANVIKATAANTKSIEILGNKIEVLGNKIEILGNKIDKYIEATRKDIGDLIHITRQLAIRVEEVTPTSKGGGNMHTAEPLKQVAKQNNS